MYYNFYIFVKHVLTQISSGIPSGMRILFCRIVARIGCMPLVMTLLRNYDVIKQHIVHVDVQVWPEMRETQRMEQVLC